MPLVEQRFYSPFTPRLERGDAAALQVQHWVQLHYAKRVTVDAMAARAKLGADISPPFPQGHRAETERICAACAHRQGAPGTRILNALN
jgi:hypothetical protein